MATVIIPFPMARATHRHSAMMSEVAHHVAAFPSCRASEDELEALSLRNAEGILRAVFGTGDVDRGRRALDVYLDAIGHDACDAPAATDDLVDFIAGQDAAQLAIEDLDALIFTTMMAASIAAAGIDRARRGGARAAGGAR